MIISNVNIGSGPGSNDGESIYSAFYKVNQNFANVQSNVNSLTNSVSSVAGRTGNVTLTIADIVGLSTTYASQANITTANVGMKGYVDAKIAANVAALIDSAPAVLDTLNELAAALNDDASFSTTIINTITLANTIQSQQITSANIGIIGYINLANTIQSQQISAANLGMKGYVDSVASQSIYGNSNVASFLPTYSGNITAQYANISGTSSGLNGLTVGAPGVEIFGNTIAQFHGNANSDLLVTVHNTNTGSIATSGFMATADIGDENNNRTLMGILGSGFVPLDWIKPLDSVLLAVGGNLVIGCSNYSNVHNIVKQISFVIGEGGTIAPVKIKAHPDLSSANIELSGDVGILFNDGSRQTSAYSNVKTATFTNLSTYAYNANVTAANLGMKGYVDSVASGSYSNVNTQAYLITNSYATQAFVNDANTALKVYTDGQVTAANTAVLNANIGMLGYVFQSNATLRSYTDGQITAANTGVTSANLGMKGYVDSAVSTANIGIIGYVDQGNSIQSAAITAANVGMKGYVDSLTYSNVQAAVFTNLSTYAYSANLTAANVGMQGYVDNAVLTANVGMKGYVDNAVATSGYSNVQVATYLPTYTGNVAAGNVKVSNAYRFETGNVNITNESGYVNLNPDTVYSATAGVKIGGSGYILGPNGARNLTLNYGSTNGTVGLQANVTIGTAGSGNLFVLGNVIARDITGGNILATGTSGVLGFNSGGFVQQATSNTTQVTSHTTSGNIQLMSIDLGAHAVHTVTFSCNKLTTDDIILLQHISGGVTGVYVDAYVSTAGLAVIWLRDITGSGTGAFTPMLKYAIIRAPSS